jgi:hypothetical protein
MHVGNALEMAADLLLLLVDEVARNGAFRKILRPEVFPDAPLHSPSSGALHFSSGCLPDSCPNPSQISGKDELILHVNTGLAEKLGHCVGFEA